MAVLAPIPSASVTAATSAKPGLRAKPRHASRRSWSIRKRKARAVPRRRPMFTNTWRRRPSRAWDSAWRGRDGGLGAALGDIVALVPVGAHAALDRGRQLAALHEVDLAEDRLAAGGARRHVDAGVHADGVARASLDAQA